MTERRLLWIALFTVAAVGYLMLFARAIEVNSRRIEERYRPVAQCAITAEVTFDEAGHSR